MPRQKRGSEWKTHLTKFLAELREKRGMTFREMARISGGSTSTVHGWANGAMPCESIGHLKRLCEHVGVPLAVALTGSREMTSSPPALSDYFEKREMFDGIAQIKLVRLIPRNFNE
jgi:transcriptional regulator with XRE-family HTH domain